MHHASSEGLYELPTSAFSLAHSQAVVLCWADAGQPCCNLQSHMMQAFICMPCRQAVKLMKLDPECGSSSRDALLIHGSLASCAAWRYAQLLHALPKRNTEASAWQEFAARHWQATDGPSRNTELEKVLGPLDILKGGTDDSPGMIVDLMLLRGLPCC